MKRKSVTKNRTALLCAVILLSVCFLPLLLCGCGQQDERLNFYTIEAVFDDEQKSLTCSQRLEYVNATDNALDKVCFFLYANAFNEGQKAVPNSYLDRAYPHEASFGGIDVRGVSVDGVQAEFLVCDGGNILTVSLQNQLFPDECVTIEMEYVVRLANIRHRLGYGDSTINFGNFFPIACVYENGFVKNDFSTSGDPFYSEVANFEVKISYPDKYILASTGMQTLNEENLDGTLPQSLAAGNIKTTICKAEKVRDFCFVLSEKFSVLSEKVGDVDVNYFYYDDAQASHHLETAKKAISTFCDLFGEYPYSQFSVVKADFCFGGMEYPNLVLIADDLLEEDVDCVITHETAHQWWYGLVGNNEFENAWVDEGLTEFSCALFFEQHPEYGISYQQIMDGATQTYKTFVRTYAGVYEGTGKVFDESMNRTLTQFATEPEYVNLTYTKGMLMFDSIRSTMSDRKFFKCLQNYFEDYKFKNSSAEKLTESFSESSHINMKKFITAWTNGQTVIGG